MAAGAIGPGRGDDRAPRSPPAGRQVRAEEKQAKHGKLSDAAEPNHEERPGAVAADVSTKVPTRYIALDGSRQAFHAVASAARKLCSQLLTRFAPKNPIVRRDSLRVCQGKIGSYRKTHNALS